MQKLDQSILFLGVGRLSEFDVCIWLNGVWWIGRCSTSDGENHSKHYAPNTCPSDIHVSKNWMYPNGTVLNGTKIQKMDHADGKRNT